MVTVVLEDASSIQAIRQALEGKVVTPVLKSPSELMVTVTLLDSWAHTVCSRRERENFSLVFLGVAILKWDLLWLRGHVPVHHFKPG